ncbi:MAG: arginine--tRNA ligase [Candidatus Nomurabacteria bacterium]|nr:arginine--tRNA ligase [Candidatus Nomurabacteria bacterium]
MNIQETIKKILTDALTTLDVAVSSGAIVLEHPTELSHGDFSANIAMSLAKKEGKNPREFAEQILAEIEKNLPTEIISVAVAGPGFINFKLADKFFADSLGEITKQGDDFGKNNNTHETWVIEHTSPNPNKAMHLGHLRNNLTGMAIANVAEWNGAHVIRDMVDNNRGIAIAKLMWGYLKFAKKDDENTDVDYWFDHQGEWETPDDQGIRPDRFVDALYVRGSEDFKIPDVEKIVRDFVVRWEADDQKIRALWQTVLDYSTQGQQMTLDRLGNKWDYKWHEHEHYQQGKDLVAEGLSKGIFQKLDDGAILTNLESYNIPDTIVQKSDGTALYITQDLALTRLKKEKYNADKLFWVIGPEQSLAMKQMFAVSEQLGTGNFSDFIHIPYGWMSLKGQGKMSSREGTVVYIDDMIDEAKAKVMERLENKDDALAEMVALGAVKFFILKVGRNQDTAFDVDESISIEGDSGPYLQYTYARCRSMLEKAHNLEIEPLSSIPDKWEITDVERLLYRFPEIIEKSLVDYAPHHVAQYLIDIAHAFNSFYGNTKIVDADDVTSPYKLAITSAVSQVIKNGLEILGIESPERM